MVLCDNHNFDRKNVVRPNLVICAFLVSSAPFTALLCRSVVAFLIAGCRHDADHRALEKNKYSPSLLLSHYRFFEPGCDSPLQLPYRNPWCQRLLQDIAERQ